MQEFYPLTVRLLPPFKSALDRLVTRAQKASPLFPPSQSDVIRRLILNADTDQSEHTHRCEHCHQDIPAGEEETADA